MGHRRSAILAAEVVGDDWPGQVDNQRKARAETVSDRHDLLADAIRRHHGRPAKAPGIEILAEFSSVLDAVRCAVEVQRKLANRNQEFSQSGQPLLRIGVGESDGDLGDEQATGNGVGAAARLATLAEPGGICISRTVYYEVRYQIKLGYETMLEPNSTAYTCGEIRDKWETMNLTELSAVKIGPAALSKRPVTGTIGKLAFFKAKSLVRESKRLLDRGRLRLAGAARRR